MQLELGTRVRCGGDVVGEIADVVIDPATQRLTHIVVETPDKQARLVPGELVHEADADADGVALTCTAEEFNALDSIREFAFLRFDEFPKPEAGSEIGVEDVVAMPYYDAAAVGDYTGEFDSNVGLTYDRIPKGEAE